MKFEWDDNKEKSNQRKHAISFLEATEVFADDYSSCVNEPDHSYDESRYLLFGISTKESYLVVSFTERAGVIRIISARCMTKQERNAYEQ